MAYTLDETDLQILKTLQRNAKLTTKELADAVHLTPTPVFERQKRLEKQGYITRIRPENNERKLFLSLTEQGEALKEKAIAVPAAMQSCIPLEREDLMLLKSLLDQALIRMDK